jgi:hypothetical protein
MSTVRKTTSFALAAAAAALLSGCGTMSGSDTMGSDTMQKTTAAVDGKCFGINSCKGQGACAGAANACAGQNSCKGQGWVKAMQSDCETKGGRFEA